MILVLRIYLKLKLHFIPCLKTLILLGIFSFLAFLFVLDFLSRFRLALKQLVPLQGLAVNNWTQSFKFQIVSTGVYKENGLQKRETWWSSSSARWSSSWFCSGCTYNLFLKRGLFLPPSLQIGATMKESSQGWKTQILKKKYQQITFIRGEACLTQQKRWFRRSRQA